MLRPVLALVLALLAPTLARAADRDERLQALPEGGVRFATTVGGASATDHRFVIGHIDRTGLHVLTQEPHSDYADFAWLDARTLLAVGTADGVAFTQRYVDGQRAGARVPVPAAAWGADGEVFLVSIRLGDDGAAWIEHCFAYSDDVPNRCTAYRAVQLDAAGAVTRVVKKAPPGTALAAFAQRGLPLAKLPKLAAPAGYAVKLHKTDITDGSAMMGDGRKVPAFTCTGPSEQTTWPTADVINWEFSTRPKSVRWVMHDPPVFVVEGPATNPIGESGPSAQVFGGCSPQAFEEVVFAPHGIWFERRSALADMVVVGSSWTARIGPHELGTFPGDSTFVIAPTR